MTPPRHCEDPDSQPADSDGGGTVSPSLASGTVPPQAGSNYEFDASAYVESGNETDQLEQRAAEALRQSCLKRLPVGPSWRPSDFITFDDRGESAPGARIEFTVDRLDLCHTIPEICLAVGLKASGRRDQFYSVRLCLSRTYATLTGYTAEIFFSRRLQIEFVEGVAVDQNIGFLLNLRQLKRLVPGLSQSDEPVTFRYDARNKWFVVGSKSQRSGQPFRLRLDVVEQGDNVKRTDQWFGSPVHLHAVDPGIVRKAVLFGRLFTQRDPSQQFRSKIVISGGTARALNFNRVGEMASDRFGKLSFAIRCEHFDVLYSLLSDFELAKTHLFDTPKHHIFHDGRTCLAVPKASHDLSSLGQNFYQTYRSKIVVCRSVMLAHLVRLTAIPENEAACHDFTVTLRVEGSLSHALLSLHAQHPGGRSNGLVVTRCNRIPGEGAPRPLPNCLIVVSLTALVTIISHVDGSNVVIEELRSGILRIQDEAPSFRTTAWISAKPPSEIEPRVEKERIGMVRFRSGK